MKQLELDDSGLAGGQLHVAAEQCGQLRQRSLEVVEALLPVHLDDEARATSGVAQALDDLGELVAVNGLRLRLRVLRLLRVAAVDLPHREAGVEPERLSPLVQVCVDLEDVVVHGAECSARIDADHGACQLDALPAVRSGA
ncbi:hypothetical protein ACTWP6_23610 [Mycobacterium sp. 4D054]|uniref:hypothetical protein n=1 Tax=Mycobacterium sp. 4D054 TaxID=3457440 RepID=UPI003FD0FFFC